MLEKLHMTCDPDTHGYTCVRVPTHLVLHPVAGAERRYGFSIRQEADISVASAVGACWKPTFQTRSAGLPIGVTSGAGTSS